MEGNFDQFQQKYRELRALRDAGRLGPQQFTAEVQKLRWQDSGHVWWAINADGAFLRYDGRQWIPAQSPQPPTRSSQAPAQGLQKPRTANSGCLSRLTASPILVIVPSLLCGGLWFLYTFMGMLDSGSISGLDCATPLIVIGLPVFFWAFRKPIDKLLLPLKPSIQGVPKRLRLGIALAVPLLLSCGCSTLTSGGYLALNVSSFVSVMTAGVLMRY